MSEDAVAFTINQGPCPVCDGYGFGCAACRESGKLHEPLPVETLEVLARVFAAAAAEFAPLGRGRPRRVAVLCDGCGRAGLVDVGAATVCPDCAARP